MYINFQSNKEWPAAVAADLQLRAWNLAIVGCGRKIGHTLAPDLGNISANAVGLDWFGFLARLDSHGPRGKIGARVHPPDLCYVSKF